MVKRDKEFIKLVGTLVANARIKNGLLQADVGVMLGFSRAQMAHIEKGTYGPTPEMMFKLAIIFKCPIEELFPSPDQYKPKIKIPPPRETKVGRKVRGPNLIKKNTEWTKRELKFLYNNIAKLDYIAIANKLNKSYTQVIYRTNVEAKTNPSAFIIPSNIPYAMQKKAIILIQQKLKEDVVYK